MSTAPPTIRGLPSRSVVPTTYALLPALMHGELDRRRRSIHPFVTTRSGLPTQLLPTRWPGESQSSQPENPTFPFVLPKLMQLSSVLKYAPPPPPLALLFPVSV